MSETVLTERTIRKAYERGVEDAIAVLREHCGRADTELLVRVIRRRTTERA
jgi:hypothetical protein